MLLLQGLFKPSVTFFTLCILQLIVLELLSMWVLYKYGNGWLPWTASLAIIVIQQVSLYNQSVLRAKLGVIHILCHANLPNFQDPTPNQSQSYPTPYLTLKVQCINRSSIKTK